MNYMYDYRTNAELAADLANAINGEYSAIACYERLAGLAPDTETKNRIMEIRQDEIRHYHVFAQFYTRLTGKQPTPRITEPCPSTYAAGIDFAFRDEQRTVDFYHDIADKTTDPTMKDTIRRIAADEQNHAVWFLYFMRRI